RLARQGRLMFTGLAADTRYAVRTITKQAGVSVMLVLVLVIAIGATTAAFSVLDALELRSLPVRDPAALVLLQWTSPTPHIEYLTGEFSRESTGRVTASSL